jgi:hypothetical protein
MKEREGEQFSTVSIKVSDSLVIEHPTRCQQQQSQLRGKGLSKIQLICVH